MFFNDLESQVWFFYIHSKNFEEYKCLRIKILQISKGHVAKNYSPPINVEQETELGLIVSRVFPVSDFSI